MLVFYQWLHIPSILKKAKNLILIDGQFKNLIMHLFPFLMEEEIV